MVFDGDRPWSFEGTYQDFLERIGWKDEEETPKPARCPGEQKKIERKDLRRLRAEMITNRSRVLNPLQERIRELQAQIISIEEQLKDDNMTLLRASAQGAGRSIAALSISIHESRKRVESLFEELEKLSVEFHVKSREFETMFKELEQKP